LALTKGVQTDLQAWANCANGSVTVGTEYNCALDYEAAISVRVGRATGTAFTAGWPNIRVEANPSNTGGSWIPLFMYQPGLGSSIANTTLNGAANAGNTSFVAAAVTNIAVGDILFVSDNTTSNFELVRVKNTSSNTVNLEEALVSTHVNAAQVTDQAEMSYATISLLPYKRLRAVVDNENSGQAICAEVKLTTTTAL
jgi:hypothetical protein